ncbi:hypothetical protein JIG36_51095 [Actinoplanes sp. LDG1-06]|uniref:Uncharacterized protein n=1 Tax=Paractinoplanes ovalisporus TaxID=2810368 RepID=A0ABS2AVL1_9ACTN|nr:hypothetical protein [Actinoplanes ovalisporus]MBM2623866.1 hypothetical protein [Actinoplanes ovalisporus]
MTYVPREPLCEHARLAALLASGYAAAALVGGLYAASKVRPGSVALNRMVLLLIVGACLMVWGYRSPRGTGPMLPEAAEERADHDQ